MRIPSFIVTLAGMLVFRGLSLAVLQGQSVGPFSPTFQKLSSGFIPDIIPGDSIRLTSLFVGVILAVILVVLNWRKSMIQLREGQEGDSIAAVADKNGLASADRRSKRLNSSH